MFILLVCHSTQHAFFAETHIKLASADENDKQQLQWFSNACKGIPQVKVICTNFILLSYNPTSLKQWKPYTIGKCHKFVGGRSSPKVYFSTEIISSFNFIFFPFFPFFSFFLNKWFVVIITLFQILNCH